MDWVLFGLFFFDHPLLGKRNVQKRKKKTRVIHDAQRFRNLLGSLPLGIINLDYDH